MKKVLVFITVFCILMTMFADTIAAASYITTKPPISIQIFGKKVTPAPIIYKDKVFVPLRAVGKALGYQVNYSEKTKTMDLISKTHKVTVTVGYTYARVNGASVKLDLSPVLSNDSIYVPLTFLQKNFKYDVNFNSDKNMVIIDKAGTGNTSVKVPPATQTPTPPAVQAPSAASNGIYVLNKKVNNQEKALTKNGIVYIPLRLVGEGLGYKVNWSSALQTMSLAKASASVSVASGKITANVNKQAIKLDGIPYLSGGRLYAPLSMISKSFGYVTNYDKSNNSVTISRETDTMPGQPSIPETKPRPDLTNIINIAYDDNGGFPQINISADKPIASFNNFIALKPDRLVIDIPKALLGSEVGTKEIGNEGIDRVRTGQLGPELVRIVVDMKSQKTYKIIQSEDKKTISILYANIIAPVTYSKEGDLDVITIKGSTAIDASHMQLENPNRIVLDVNRAVFNNLLQEIPASSQLLKSVRIGQYEAGIARVVLDVVPDIYYNVKTTGDTTKIYISSYPFEFVEYKTYYNTGVINLSPGKEGNYNVTVDSVTNSVNVVIPQDLKLERNRIDVNDNLIKYIDIDTVYQNGSKVTIAAIKMQDAIESEVISPAAAKLIKIRFKRKITSLNQLTIVIDAGHGGKDPGAVARDGTREKDLNLDVAIRLEKHLKALGFNTIMTRNNDTFVELGGRTDIANKNYADFFISIHFNAFNMSSNGIETLYYPNLINEDYNISNKKIADIFHVEVVNALNRSSRGINARPNLYVLNKTKMPAILAELGFITNPEELALAKTEAYREKASRALAVSILKYYRDIQGVNIDIDINSIYTWPYPEQLVQQILPEQTLDQPIVSEEQSQAPVLDAAVQP